MKAGPDAYKLIKHFEGLRLRAYLCPAGVPTIGYGCTGRDVYLGLTITSDEAEDRLRNFVGNLEDVLSGCLPREIKRNEFDALISFIFNIGTSSFLTSNLLKRVQGGEMREAGDEFLRWVKHGVWDKKLQRRVLKTSSGLTRRRVAERELFLSGELRLG